MDLQPVYFLRVGSGLVQASPCANTLTLPLWSGGPAQAQVLHFTCDFQPLSLKVRARAIGKPNQPLRYKLTQFQYLTGIYEEYAQGEIPASLVSSSWQWVSVPMDPKGKQVNTQCFYVSFVTDSGSVEGQGCRDCYELEGMQVPPGLQDPAMGTFDGGAHRSRASTSLDGKTWKDRFEADANVQLTGDVCMERKQAEPVPPVVPLPPSFSGVWGGRP